MKAIPGKFQSSLVSVDTDENKIRNVVRKTYTLRRKISLLVDVKIRKRFEEKVTLLVDVGMPSLKDILRMWFKVYVMRCVGRRG